jgi:hypothetical protein
LKYDVADGLDQKTLGVLGGAGPNIALAGSVRHG